MDADLLDYLTKFKLYDELDCIPEVWQEKAYTFHKDVVRGMIVLDVGSTYGSFAHYAIAKGAKKVYAIEPLPDREYKQRLLIDKLQLSNKIVSLHLGVWKEGKNMKIDGNTHRIMPQGIDVMTKSVDQIVVDFEIEKVDFIKIDTEGTELPIINGAEATVYRDKPILAVAGYHLPFYDANGELIGDGSEMNAIISFLERHHPNYTYILNPRDSENQTLILEPKL